MKQPIRVGMVCLARKTFDYNAANELFIQIQANIKEIEYVSWIVIPDLIITIKDAVEATKSLSEEKLDGLIVISGTFALGNLILQLNQLNCPLLLWGLEELPYDGGKIRLNSISGVNLNSSNLYKANTQNFHVIVGNDYLELKNWLDAIRMIKSLSLARIGILGQHADGFVNLIVDDLDLKNQTGVIIDHYTLNQIFDLNVDESEIIERKNQLANLFETSAITPQQLHKVAELAVKFDRFITENQLTALAIRCWPEFASEYGIAPCAAMSLLQSEHKILACEGDILGCISMLLHESIGGETPFLADFSQLDIQQDTALLWHCGVAACNLWDKESVRSLDPYFANGKGVTADFVMKSGKFSLFRIDITLGEYKIFLQKGTAIPMEKELKGTYLKAIFDKDVCSIFEMIVYNGIPHHLSLVYGDFIRPFEILAKLKGWKIIQ